MSLYLLIGPDGKIVGSTQDVKVALAHVRKGVPKDPKKKGLPFTALQISGSPVSADVPAPVAVPVAST